MDLRRGENTNADAVISNIRIHIMRLSPLIIRIRLVIAVIECGYYSLSAYEVMVSLDYYPNLYAGLNKAVITLCNLKIN
jgi:hypothetical protein